MSLVSRGCAPWSDSAAIPRPAPARTTARACNRCTRPLSAYNPESVCHACMDVLKRKPKPRHPRVYR